MFSFEINVLCDVDYCDEIFTTEPLSSCDLPNVKKLAKYDGWYFLEGTAAICPKCLQNICARTIGKPYMERKA